LVNVPIVHFSVDWWNTLHQGATIKLFGKSAMDPSMIAPLIALALRYQAVVRRPRCWPAPASRSPSRARQGLGQAGAGRCKCMSEWFDDGRYSAYVWTCFALFFLSWRGPGIPAWRLRRLKREIALRSAAMPHAAAAPPRTRFPEGARHESRAQASPDRREPDAGRRPVAGSLIALALQSNLNYLHSPSDVIAGKAPESAVFRSAASCWRAACRAVASRAPARSNTASR
jgi:hypothetical protein